MANPHVTYAQNAGLHVLRYYGRVDYMFAPAIQRFVDQLIAQSSVGAMVIDLTEAECLDSTNLGLLARLADRLRCDFQTRCMMISTNEEINCVLRSMSFEELMEIVPTVNGSRDAPPLHDIQAEIPSEHELQRTMLEAHRALVALSEAGRVQFQDVVACLESGLPQVPPPKVA